MNMNMNVNVDCVPDTKCTKSTNSSLSKETLYRYRKVREYSNS